MGCSFAGMVVAGCAALFCLAASAPTTNESSERGNAKSDRPRLGRIDGERPMSWRDRNATTRPSEEEEADVDAFMSDNSPERWKKIKEMPEKRQQNIRQFVTQRYRML